MSDDRIDAMAARLAFPDRALYEALRGLSLDVLTIMEAVSQATRAEMIAALRLEPCTDIIDDRHRRC